MTAFTRRLAAATFAALMPLAAISIATAAPSVAETTCAPGQSEFNGSCVDNCNKSQVRNADTGKCQSLLSAALQKAETPAVAKLTPEQMGGAWQLAKQAQMIARGHPGLELGGRYGRHRARLAGAGHRRRRRRGHHHRPPQRCQRRRRQLPSGMAGAAGGAATGMAQTFSAANDVAQVARALPSPRIGLPKLPNLKMPRTRGSSPRRSACPRSASRTRRSVCRSWAARASAGRSCCSSLPASRAMALSREERERVPRRAPCRRIVGDHGKYPRSADRADLVPVLPRRSALVHHRQPGHASTG